MASNQVSPGDINRQNHRLPSAVCSPASSHNPIIDFVSQQTVKPSQSPWRASPNQVKINYFYCFILASQGTNNTDAVNQLPLGFFCLFFLPTCHRRKPSVIWYDALSSAAVELVTWQQHGPAPSTNPESLWKHVSFAHHSRAARHLLHLNFCVWSARNLNWFLLTSTQTLTDTHTHKNTITYNMCIFFLICFAYFSLISSDVFVPEMDTKLQ